jgi:hypothetical protein
MIERISFIVQLRPGFGWGVVLRQIARDLRV